MTIDDIMALADNYARLNRVPVHNEHARSSLRTAIQSALDEARMDGVRQGAEWGIAKSKADAHTSINEAVKAERERCAKVCINLYGPKDWYDGNSVSEQCAAAIRKGETT